METIYVKRFTKQDITKSYSPSTDATRDFFGVDLNMTQEYVNIDVCYYGNQNCPPDITIHKGYQGEKDWRICGDNFKPLYAFRNPEEGDLSVWKRSGRNGAYKFTIQVVKKDDPDYKIYEKFLDSNDNHLYLGFDQTEANGTTFPFLQLQEGLSNEEYYKILGQILNDEYNNGLKKQKAVGALYYFGLCYQKFMLDHNLDDKHIIENAPDVKESFSYEFNKMKNIFLYAEEKGCLSNIYNNEKKDEAKKIDNANFVNNYQQIIYYGVPGSGKSFKIDKILENVPNDQKMRVVFHPEYTNADFIGQILPIEDNGVDYRFKAGPFSRILKRAFENPSKPFYLIIEEINRGNAAAIFGDLFQLLDRNGKGFSSYPIENIDINSFIRSENNLHNDKNVPSTVQVGNTQFTENTEITLPPNLAIFATMNTSDQNVFTLDNAFQRRWSMELVENKFDKNNEDEKNQAESKLEVFNITWGDFQNKINAEISKQAVESGLSSMEDKRLGCWFVKPDKSNNTISTKLFSEKVLKYLWDDAFKFVRTEVFENEFQTLEDLSNAYQNGTNIFRDKSFLSLNPVENV